MNSTIEDIQLGADLVIKAIGEDVKSYLTRHENADTLAAREEATKALRALSIWQIDADILVADENTRYSIKEKKLNKLSDADIQEGGALYRQVLETQMPLMTDMHLAGKTAYVSYFSDVHRPVQLDIEVPENRLTEASLDAVAARSLSLVEAAWRDPSSAARLEGISPDDLTHLTDALYEAGYLTPGENPDRGAALSEQSPRGDYDQKMAIYDVASTITSNIELPDTVTGLDAVVLSAKQLEASVAAVETEEVFVRSQTPGIRDLTPINSDLQNDDLGALYMTLLLGAMVTRKAQVSMDIDDHDPENPLVVVPASFTIKEADGKLTEERDILETLGNHVQYLEDTGVMDVISRGANPRTKTDFMVPGLAPTDNQLPFVAQSLKSFLSAAKAASAYVQDEDERIDGDAGSRALGGPHAGMDEDQEEAGETFDEDIDLEAEDGTITATMSDGMDDLDTVDRKIPEKFVERMAKVIDDLESTGVLRRMSEIIGRDEKHNDQEIFSEGRTSVFSSLEDFMQGDGSATMDPADREYRTDTYGLGQLSRLSKDRADNLAKSRPVLVTPDRGFLAKTNYKPGGPGVATQRVKDFVQANLVDEDGNPNIALRQTLKKMADRPIIATTEIEAKAWKQEAQKFVEREAEEHRLRLEAAEEKAGIWTLQAPKRDLQRVLTIAQASQSTQPLKVSIGDIGATLSSPDMPKITLTGGKDMPEDMAKVAQHRTPGGLLSLDKIQGALESMDNNEQTAYIVMTGERPKGIVSQVVTQSELARQKAAKPKGLEPHLPDFL